MDLNIIWKGFAQLFTKFWAFISTEPTSTIIAGVIVFVVCEWIKEISKVKQIGRRNEIVNIFNIGLARTGRMRTRVIRRPVQLEI